MEKTIANIQRAITNLLSPESSEITVRDMRELAETFVKTGGFDELLKNTENKAILEIDEGVWDYVLEHLVFLLEGYKASVSQKFADEATTIIVKLDGKPFETYLDEHGTQRFRKDTVICGIVDSTPYLLNSLAVRYQEGEFAYEDWLRFYTGLGYSLGGFEDLSDFTHVEIDNPLWNE